MKINTSLNEGELVQIENICDLLELDLETNHSHFVLYKELCSDVNLASRFIYLYDRVYLIFLKDEKKTRNWFFNYNHYLGDSPIKMMPDKLDYLVGYINNVVLDGGLNPGLATKV